MLVRCVSQIQLAEGFTDVSLRGLGCFRQSYSIAFTQASNSIATSVLQTVFCVNKMCTVRLPMLQGLQPFIDYKGN